jgi:hypothetical protein
VGYFRKICVKAMHSKNSNPKLGPDLNGQSLPGNEWSGFQLVKKTLAPFELWAVSCL